MTARLRKAVLIVAGMAAITAAARLLGYQLGGYSAVRCRKGHLFTTLWIPGIKLGAVDLGIARFQRCPVGWHWSLVLPVRDRDLTDAERAEARAHRVRLP